VSRVEKVYDLDVLGQSAHGLLGPRGSNTPQAPLRSSTGLGERSTYNGLGGGGGLRVVGIDPDGGGGGVLSV